MPGEIPPDIRPCSESDFGLVKQYIAAFDLDDRELRQEEFLTMHHNAQLIGFGRVREYGHFSEMCSTGIIEKERSRGLGTLLLQALEKKATRQVYLVCIIPAFFERLGFEICHSYPRAMQDKLDYCIAGLPVPEPYVVMTKKPQAPLP